MISASKTKILKSPTPLLQSRRVSFELRNMKLITSTVKVFWLHLSQFSFQSFTSILDKNFAGCTIDIFLNTWRKHLTVVWLSLRSHLEGKKRSHLSIFSFSVFFLLVTLKTFSLLLTFCRFTMSSSVQFSSLTQLCLTLCDSMDCSKPGLPVHQQLPGFTQTHVHWVGDAIQPSHPLSSPSPPAFNLSQYQGLFKWVSSSHQAAKVLEFQL